jgi:deoxyhypusine synthase
MKKVKQVDITQGMTVNSVIKELALSNVMGGGKLAGAVSVTESMIKDKECKVFLGAAGALVPGGMRDVLISMLEKGWVDVFVTTGAMLTHDLVEALGYNHYQGSENDDDAELFKKGYDRMYNSLMPNKVYEKLEEFFNKNYDEFKGCSNIKEFLWAIGKLAPGKSILSVAYEKKIPIFCPAIADSGIGLMMWGIIAKGKKLDVKAFDDMKEIIDIAWKAKKCGVLYLGGGVPKNFIQQSMQFSPTTSSYGVQITMDRPEPGGSSGAELKEGISWGKMSKKALNVNLTCDVTIALPFIYSSLLERLK